MARFEIRVPEQVIAIYHVQAESEADAIRKVEEYLWDDRFTLVDDGELIFYGEDAVEGPQDSSDWEVKLRD